MKHLLSTAAIAAMLAASPALAANDAMKEQSQAQAQTQTQPPAQTETPAQTEQPGTDTNKAVSGAASGQAGMSSGDFLTAQQTTDWLSSDLVGQSVQNDQGEALGDINNIVVNEDGEVVAVVIGVGGFLGIGQKAVAVRYDALEFKEQAATPPASPPGAAPGGSPMTQSPRMGQGASQTTASNPQDNRVIVLSNASRDQLEAAPAYKYVSESASETSSGSGERSQ